MPKHPLPIQHGTAGGYDAHRYRGETACADCKVAHSRAEAQRRAVERRILRQLRAEYPALHADLAKRARREVRSA